MSIMSFFDPKAYKQVSFTQDDSTFNLTCLTQESHDLTNAITDNPVETGSSVVDHVQRQPRKYTLSGLVSDAPVTLLDLADAFSSRMTKAYNYMEALWESGNPVTIKTKFKTLENMVLESLSVPRSRQTGNAFSFSATFKEVTVVDTEASTVSPVSKKATAKQAAPNENKGKQATQAPSTAGGSSFGSILSNLTGVGL